LWRAWLEEVADILISQAKNHKKNINKII
jgi:hypothetical protein